jgi:hypothetical protein
MAQQRRGPVQEPRAPFPTTIIYYELEKFAMEMMSVQERIAECVPSWNTMTPGGQASNG